MEEVGKKHIQNVKDGYYRLSTFVDQFGPIYFGWNSIFRIEYWGLGLGGNEEDEQGNNNNFN